LVKETDEGFGEVFTIAPDFVEAVENNSGFEGSISTFNHNELGTGRNTSDVGRGVDLGKCHSVKK
jgi:hypothetical protein